jgi:type IV secretion system protein VirB10
MSDPLPEERGVSDVASTKTAWLTPKRKAIALAIGTVVVLAFIFWRNSSKHVEDVAPPPANGIGQIVQYEEPKETLPPMSAPQRPSFVTPQPQLQPAPQPLPAPQPQPLLPAPHLALPTPAQKPKSHRMLSFDTIEVKESHGGANGAAPQPEGDAGTHVMFKPTPITGAQVGPAIDKTLVLMPGVIRCILDVAVDSQMPGPLMCHLPDPVISDGNVVLMEAGSKIMGSYNSEVKQGQNRIMAVSATGFTPNGVPVPFGGPFADSLGRTGLPGEVDNHYLQRFGGAVLLTFLEGGLGIIQSSVSKGGNSYLSLNSGGGGGVSSLAEEVLRASINIPPTITKNEGDEIYLWILQPIDFSPAYKLINK